MTRTGLFAIVLALYSVVGSAEEVEINFDDSELQGAYLDRWMYPFNQTPGKRIQAPTFGALGSEGFDERDGQYVIAVDTVAAGIAAELHPSQYKIHSATLTLTETFGGYEYDPTYDSFKTYLDPTTPLFEPDEDAGRPIELYGVGLRGEFTEFGWPDGEAVEPPLFGSVSSFGGRGKEVRSAFATDALGRDVSNNVMSLASGENGFDPKPFAVARMLVGEEELEPGASVKALTSWSFEIDVEDPDIHNYLSSSFSKGQLGFAVTSLHSTGLQGQGDPFPNPATANHFAFAGPQITLDVEILDSLRGDFDDDGQLTVADIDLLSAAVRSNEEVARFDLNLDNVLSDQDRVVWVEDVFGSFLGDFNLDHQVAFSDFILLAQNFRQDGGWGEGDLNGDGQVTFPDFVGLATNYGQPDVAAAGVPEPSSLLLVATILLFIPTHCRKGHFRGRRTSKGNV